MAGLWLALAFVTWNIVFGREVSLAAGRFTRESVERHLRGDEVPTINAAYRPHVRAAALSASLWAGGVLALGAVALGVTGRPTTPLGTGLSNVEGRSRRPGVLP